MTQETRSGKPKTGLSLTVLGNQASGILHLTSSPEAALNSRSLGSVGVLKKLGIGGREKKVPLNSKALLPTRVSRNDENVLNLCCPIS